MHGLRATTSPGTSRVEGRVMKAPSRSTSTSLQKGGGAACTA